MCEAIERCENMKTNLFLRLQFFFFSIGTDLIDPDDPTYIAENELFNAAQSIELAAKKLSVLKPRRKPKVHIKSFLSFYLHGN
jgi:hypothetical protein